MKGEGLFEPLEEEYGEPGSFCGEYTKAVDMMIAVQQVIDQIRNPSQILVRELVCEQPLIEIETNTSTECLPFIPQQQVLLLRLKLKPLHQILEFIFQRKLTLGYLRMTTARRWNMTRQKGHGFQS
jgi:hypothetical protein